MSGEGAGAPDLRTIVADEVEKALRVLLPELIDPRLEAVRKDCLDMLTESREKDRESGNRGQDEVQKRAVGCTYKDFLNCKPQEFTGKGKPTDAVSWLTHIEKIFRTSKCADEDQVEYAPNLLQRSWVILFTTALIMLPLYLFATPLLLLIGQTDDIAHAAGKMALWMIPQLFAYSLNYPMAKFLQAQSKIMVMAYIAGTALVLHTFFSWLLMLKLGWGLMGGAVVLNSSWWFIVVSQMIYIFSGSCGRAWSGFSWGAFSNLWSFVKLSFASAVMLW